MNLTLSYSQPEESRINHLITTPLPALADLFDVADACAAFVCVLIDTHDDEMRNALCGRLLQALNQLRYLCDEDLPPHLVEQLIAGESMTSCMPHCWQETVTPVEYAQALTQVLLGNMLPPPLAKSLTGCCEYGGGVCEGAVPDRALILCGLPAG